MPRDPRTALQAGIIRPSNFGSAKQDEQQWEGNNTEQTSVKKQGEIEEIKPFFRPPFQIVFRLFRARARVLVGAFLSTGNAAVLFALWALSVRDADTSDGATADAYSAVWLLPMALVLAATAVIEWFLVRNFRLMAGDLIERELDPPVDVAAVVHAALNGRFF